MAYLAKVDASIIIPTSVEFVSGQSLLGPVLGVVIPVGTTLLPFHTFIERSTLRRPLRICFNILNLSPRSLTARGTFMAIASKAAVIARIILPKTRRLRSLKIRLCYRAFLFVLVRIRATSPRCNHSRRPP